jgi:prepilin-type N-terminal cleavage/methylation domain-containing protein
MGQAMHRRSGFTLVELLVVLAILSLLLTFGFRAFQGWISQGEVAATEARLTHVEMLLEQYKNAQGDYPSSKLDSYGIKVRNRVNEGNEALVLALAHKDYGGNGIDEDYLEDLEEDAPDKNVTKFANAKLLEVVDEWHNPFFYVRYDDYGRAQEYVFVDALNVEPMPATVKAEKSAMTGNYHANESYQLRSAGPDGVFGNEDDIASYRVPDE